MTELKKMTPIELRATLSIAGLFALRLLGLFMVLPLLSLYAKGLSGATPDLIGIAVGCYGLTQALFQIPLGNLSDRLNRKLVIAIGLIIFIIGSAIAAYASSIWVLILGRALQGVGAVGSSTIALIADYTRKSQRTKAMAILGASIGVTFIMALMLGSFLNKWLTVQDLFEVAVFLGMLCLFILYTLPAHQYVPSVPEGSFAKQVKTILASRDLVLLNIGIFILHTIFTSCFVVLPILLYRRFGMPAELQWQVYLPGLITGIIFILPILRRSPNEEQNTQISQFILFIFAISLLWLWKINTTLTDIVIGLSLFFAGFNFLEAILPAQISKLAPADSKGTTMGFYSCSQFLGIFVGGVLGGAIYGHFNPSAVFLFCAMLALVWITISLHRSRQQKITETNKQSEQLGSS